MGMSTNQTKKAGTAGRLHHSDRHNRTWVAACARGLTLSSASPTSQPRHDENGTHSAAGLARDVVFQQRRRRRIRRHDADDVGERVGADATSWPRALRGGASVVHAGRGPSEASAEPKNWGPSCRLNCTSTKLRGQYWEYEGYSFKILIEKIPEVKKIYKN